jgi:uncharacterized protein (TIGR00645 family)
MNRVIGLIETVLIASRWLMVPVYLAMILLLGMIVAFFLEHLVGALPGLLQISEKDLIILTLSLVDLSLVANLVILAILSGYENFVSHLHIQDDDFRPEWLTKIDFGGLKLKLVGTMTVIAAIHLLGSFLEVDQENNRSLGWQVIIVMIFALLGVIFALTEKISDKH